MQYFVQHIITTVI